MNIKKIYNICLMFIFPTIAVLLFIMFPTPVFADRTDQCGDNMTFSQKGTILTIEGTGNMYNYDQGNSYPWDNNITEVVIGSGVTSIGDYAFAWCSQLEKINIPASVTSIGEGTFENCFSLTTVSFIGDSQLETIGDYAFAGCHQLEKINIPASVASIGNAAFAGCFNVNVSTNNCHFVKKDNAIYYVDAKQLLWVPTQVESISIDDSTTSIGDYAFTWCSQLKDIEIPANVISIGKSTFEDCSSLTTVSFIGDSQLKTIGDYAFTWCSQLKDIEIPASVTSIGNYAFAWCSQLEKINIPASVTSIGNAAFAGCSNVNVESNPNFKKTDSALYSADATQLLWVSTQVKSITINTSTTSIGDHAFAWCSLLEKIEIPASVTYIDNAAFAECFSLTTVSFIGDSQLRTIGNYAFAWCSQLEKIDIPASVTSIGAEAFPCTLINTLKGEINGVSITYYHLYVNTQTGNITDVCSAEPCNISLKQEESELHCTIESNNGTCSYYVTPNKITEEIYEFALQHNNLSTNMLCRLNKNNTWQIISPQNDLLIACLPSEQIPQVSQPSSFTGSSLEKYLKPLQSEDPSDTLQLLVKAIFYLRDAAVSLTNSSSANSPFPTPSSIDGIIDKDKKCKPGGIWQKATVLWGSRTILRVTYNTDTSATKVMVRIASYTYTLELSSGSSYIDIPVPFKWYAEKIRITPLDEDNAVPKDVLTYSINTYLAKEIECKENNPTHKNFAIAAYYCGKYAAEYENS